MADIAPSSSLCFGTSCCSAPWVFQIPMYLAAVCQPKQRQRTHEYHVAGFKSGCAIRAERRNERQTPWFERRANDTNAISRTRAAKARQCAHASTNAHVFDNKMQPVLNTPSGDVAMGPQPAVHCCCCSACSCPSPCYASASRAQVEKTQPCSSCARCAPPHG